jgi:hypothetical protein
LKVDRRQGATRASEVPFGEGLALGLGLGIGISVGIGLDIGLGIGIGIGIGLRIGSRQDIADTLLVVSG